ncbi:MAG: leucine-rich repeat domain-containing protein, partial [Candidatus Neoclostridium sp.]
GNCLIETKTKTLVLGCKNTIIPSDGSVTTIGSFAFSGCSSLMSISIPNSVTSIGSYAFDNCSGLTSITIPDSVTFIGSFAFSNCSGLTSITIPNSVTSIGESAFWGCDSLTQVNYKGTEDQWNKIQIGGGNSTLTGAKINYI